MLRKISKERLSALKLHKSIRSVWVIDPTTRCKGNDKVYDRKKEKKKIKEEIKEEDLTL